MARIHFGKDEPNLTGKQQWLHKDGLVVKVTNILLSDTKIWLNKDVQYVVKYRRNLKNVMNWNSSLIVIFKILFSYEMYNNLVHILRTVILYLFQFLHNVGFLLILFTKSYVKNLNTLINKKAITIFLLSIKETHLS